jgi:hypothetical protein
MCVVMLKSDWNEEKQDTFVKLQGHISLSIIHI